MKLGNKSIVFGILMIMLTVVGFLTFAAIQSNDKNERLIAELNNNFELKISQVRDKITGQQTVVIEKIYNQDGKNGRDGEDGKDGENGKDGIDGLNGVNGTSVTPQQIAIAVSQYLAANPPSPGANGQDGEAAREIEFCYMSNGELGQRYVGTTSCSEISKPEKVEE